MVAEPDWYNNPWDHFGPNGESLRCAICGGSLHYTHDHRADNSGLDDGPPLREPRKRPEPKPAAEVKEIRTRAWATRREKYGQFGHR